MKLKAFLVTFFKHVLKFLVFFFFETAVINHFVKPIYILCVMFKDIIHFYCAVADLADKGYSHYNDQADTAAFD